MKNVPETFFTNCATHVGGLQSSFGVDSKINIKWINNP